MVRPAHRVVPKRSGSFGDEVVTFAREHGADLDEWQAQSLDDFSGTLKGKPCSPTNVLVIARQNGKSELAMWRALYGLFVLRKRLILYSSHMWASSNEIFLRMKGVIESSDALSAQVKTTRLSAAMLGFELVDGGRIMFVTRSRATARGFSADEVYFDEAHFLSEASHASLKPAAAGRSVESTPQFFYFASAPDQTRHPDCFVLTRLRQNALAGQPGIAYVEYNAGILDAEGVEMLPAAIPPAILVDPEHVSNANPGAPKRISVDFLLDAARTMDSLSYAVEHLNMGDWPDLDLQEQGMVSVERWLSLRDETSQAVAPVWFGTDVSPDRRNAAVAAAGHRRDGDYHVELTDALEGVGWLPPRLKQLISDHAPYGVVCESAQQLLADDLWDSTSTPITVLDRPQVARACAFFADCVNDGKIRHLGDPRLLDALKGAKVMSMGDSGWCFSRRSSRVDLSPLYAAIFAVYEAGANGPADTPVIIY